MPSYEHTPKIAELATIAGLIQPGEIAPSAIRRVAELVACLCLDVLEALDQDKTETAHGALDEMFGAENNPLLDQLAQWSDLIKEGESAPPPLQHFARLIVERCLDLVELQASGELQSAYVTLGDEFGAASTAVSTGSGYACAVNLVNAPQLSATLRELAEDTFYRKLIEQFGDVEPAALAFEKWEASEGGGPWHRATQLCEAAVLAALPKPEGERLNLGKPLGAHFEVVFIYDVN